MIADFRANWYSAAQTSSMKAKMDSKKTELKKIRSTIKFCLGMCVLSLIAFLFPDWRSLAKVNAVLQLVLLPISFWLPESPRWLRQNAVDNQGDDNGNLEKAEKVERRISFYTKTSHKKGTLETENSNNEKTNCTNSVFLTCSERKNSEPGVSC